MNEENFGSVCIDFETFLDIGTYLINELNEPRIIMNTVLQELLCLHRFKKIQTSDSELFSVSSDGVDTEFKYYISEDEVFIDLE
jgi:hypothetical protein